MRVGIVGGGAMAAVHARTLLTSARHHLVAVSAPILGTSMTAILSSADIPHVELDELLSEPVLDALVVATPTDTHAEVVRSALARGLAVFCEKPLALDADEARRLAADGADRLTVGHVVRYFPEYRAAHDVVSEGRLGSVVRARLVRRNAGPPPGSWYAEVDRSGGVLTDLGIHDIDWCLWSLGPVARVYARASGPVDRQVATVLLRHRNGALASLDLSWRERSFSTAIEVAGTKGRYRSGPSGAAGFEVVPGPEDALRPDGPRAARREDGPSSATTQPAETDGPGVAPGGSGAGGLGTPEVALPATSLDDDPYRAELEAALDFLAGGEAPLLDLADAVQAVVVAAAARRSLATGRPVDLEATGASR